MSIIEYTVYSENLLKIFQVKSKDEPIKEM